MRGRRMRGKWAPIAKTPVHIPVAGRSSAGHTIAGRNNDLWRVNVNALDARIAPLTELQPLLPRLLQHLSLSRAQIAIDQLRSTLAAGGADRILLLIGFRREASDTPIAAAIAIQQPESDPTVATLLHAGPLDPVDETLQRSLIDTLSPFLNRQLVSRGVRFAQWATDPGPNNEPVASWCRGFGFAPVGTLDYLTGLVPPEMPTQNAEPLQSSAEPLQSSAGSQAAARSLRFSVVDLHDHEDYHSFEQLVETTYQQSLDCPALANHRTAADTLRGYRVSPAFEPQGWFRVLQVDDKHDDKSDDTGHGTEVGCVILGLHPPPPDSDSGQSVTEIVYMGIVPSARGKKFGRQLVDHAFDHARSLAASRLILAVDQDNAPARAIYQACGLSPMLSETVWVKSIK
jgi:ribosomal protein S18 acetylase RimI-like enzyme